MSRIRGWTWKYCGQLYEQFITPFPTTDLYRGFYLAHPGHQISYVLLLKVRPPQSIL